MNLTQSLHFVVGTLDKDTNFQVYLLDGIFRWNEDRAAEAVHRDSQTEVAPLTYNGPLKHQTNMLWEELCGKPLFAKYTGMLNTQLKNDTTINLSEKWQSFIILVIQK